MNINTQICCNSYRELLQRQKIIEIDPISAKIHMVFIVDNRRFIFDEVVKTHYYDPRGLMCTVAAIVNTAVRKVSEMVDGVYRKNIWIMSHIFIKGRNTEFIWVQTHDHGENQYDSSIDVSPNEQALLEYYGMWVGTLVTVPIKILDEHNEFILDRKGLNELPPKP